MKNTILFDLDGTLTDPKEGITKSVAYALRQYGIEADPDTLTDFIGPPLVDSFMKYYGFSYEQGKEGELKYREYFSVTGWAENVPYPGIFDLLQSLKDAGKRLLIATSKPELFSLRIVEHFGLAPYFDLVCGAPMDDIEAGRKPAVIRETLRRSGTPLSDAVMVGDRRHDIEGAHQVGLPAVGVLYGYGDRAELEAAGADHIAEDLEQLRSLLLNL